MSSVITGGCLCSGVRYEIRGPFLRASYCHCSRCRRHSGAGAGVQGRVRREDFHLISGADLIRAYRPPDGGAVKAFCTACGSSLFGGEWPDGSKITVRLGTIDGDPGVRPQFHTFVGSKVVWESILDGLPQYEEQKPD